MDTTYSRSYLQGIPEKRKQDTMNSLINREFHQSLVNNAAAGKTSYMVEDSVWIRHNNSMVNHPSHPPISKFTRDEFITAIEKQYPDCKVIYQETWVDVGINNRTLKKGIVIDWS
jgi:hypothetical protein